MLVSATREHGSAQVRSPEEVRRDLKRNGLEIERIERTLSTLKRQRFPGKSGKDINTRREQVRRALRRAKDKRERLKAERNEILS